MKLCIFGSRDFTDYDLLSQKASEINFDTLVCGEAKGADSLGKSYALSNGIEILSYPANWNMYGNRAGYIRNVQMAKVCDHGLCFWDGKSKGTKMMIEITAKLGKPVTIIRYNVSDCHNQITLF